MALVPARFAVAMTRSDFLSRLALDGVAVVAPEGNLTLHEGWFAIVHE